MPTTWSKGGIVPRGDSIRLPSSQPLSISVPAGDSVTFQLVVGEEPLVDIRRDGEIIIYREGGEVRVRRSGEVEVIGNVSMNQAAFQFWEAVAKLFPGLQRPDLCELEWIEHMREERTRRLYPPHTRVIRVQKGKRMKND